MTRLSFLQKNDFQMLVTCEMEATPRITTLSVSEAGEIPWAHSNPRPTRE